MASQIKLRLTSCNSSIRLTGSIDGSKPYDEPGNRIETEERDLVFETLWKSEVTGKLELRTANAAVWSAFELGKEYTMDLAPVE